ncbi:MAG TPA: FtsX-like permease family protein [Gaiellaceae bacterium]|nr:FtsX-like permease family protein [Gaiellaceae bacterium]
MIRVALRGMMRRKLRTLLTAIAIVLGVALITGTYVLTDSIKGAFGGIFTSVYRGTDATVTGKSAFDLSGSGTTTAPPFDQSLLPVIRNLPDVADAVGGVGGSAHLVLDGKVVHFGGAPNLGFSVDPTQPELNTLTLVDGKWPGQNQVVIDEATAHKKDLQVGQSIGVQANGPTLPMRISGLVHFGGASSLGGATLSGFNLPTAQRLFQRVGKLDQIRAKAKPGVTPARLAAEIRNVLPAGTQVRTGQGQAKEDAKDTESFLNFLQDFLLAFGGIALFVGSFVIANSLSITIAQRTRELATLRTLGATRRQVRRSIVIEGFAIGTLASVIGIFVGLGLGVGLFKLFDAVGFTLPNNGLVLHQRTVIVALIVGIFVTVLASLRPAVRATRVPPIAAVREGSHLPPGRFARYRPVGSALLTALGFGLLIYGLFRSGLGTKGVLLFMGVGTLLIFVGVSLLAARFTRPLAWALGAPASRFGGAAGALARDNARRNPQRTASTASALMIGLALVTLVAVIAAGITKSFRGAVDDLWISGYAITAQNNFDPIPIAAGDAAAKTPGVQAIANVRGGDAEIFGSVHQATAVNPGGAEIFNINWLHGGSNAVIANLGANGAFVDDGFAKDHNLTIGSPLKLTAPTGQSVELRVKGIFKPPTGGSPFGPVTISDKTWDGIYDAPQNLYSFVRMKTGETDANKAALEQQLKGFPNAKVQTKHEFIDNQISGLNAILNVLYVLLALSVVVSLFGIINTLVLTVFERTREIGMLRAVGMTRRQVRRMIRAESVITALMGGVIGILLGLVLGGLLAARVDFIVFALPWGQVIVFAIAAIVVGLLAAIFPARRAGKLNVLEALQYE